MVKLSIEKTNLPLDTIFHGECVDIMKKISDKTIDCIFSDPPYNLQLKGELKRPNETLVDGVFEEWDKFDTYDNYDKFSIEWLTQAKRILKDDGTIWVIGSYHNIFRLGRLMQDMGFWILNDVIWLKSNPMPNFRGRRFTNAHETMIWAAKSNKSKYCFNYQAMKALNEDIQMRSDWYLPLCTGHERLKNKEGRKLHPTQKPESLLHRIIVSSTEINDVILDPFGGTGTTAAVAKRLGRHYISIEKDKSYVEGARKRLKNILRLEDNAVGITPAKRKEPRIPFGTFVENGDLPPGTILKDKNKRIEAMVTPDGTLVYGNHRGSIHKMGALLTGAASCNGWTFWYFEKRGTMFPIDYLRQNYNNEVVKKI